ncbi:TIR domain-containing protein [Saccharothrix sp. S26]|uniref:WD40 domain-containing protein n=1 Tax=Saccharothrix sp. S26 TaxID=2907215 RepID=UPI001F47D63E|nr:TIR domain-containing protein [Saccharothrix sp. S26]MCE6998156.1 TIR domain-containing protein [Saccharothrix sp. S26]
MRQLPGPVQGASVPPPRGPRPPRSGPVDFFISYSLLDAEWAVWIAHQLEDAGYDVMIQSWDFVPGTHFLDFIDRGIREAGAVIAVLSRNYLASRYGRLEWMAALQAAHDQPSTKLLLPVRIENVFPEGLLAPITFVDLVGIDDPAQARQKLLDRLGHALTGRAKPDDLLPRYPGRPTPLTDATPTLTAPAHPPTTVAAPRRDPVAYPPSVSQTAGPRDELAVLHVAAPRFGPGRPGPVERLAALETALDDVTREGPPAPELVVLSGSLTESGTPDQFDQVLGFVTGLRSLLGLEADRVVVVPGVGDITAPACEAYFADCRADGIEPQPPYFRKWRHYARAFGQLHPGIDGPGFDQGQPWSLFAVPDLRVVVAGLNSTVTHTHLTLTEPGVLGDAQLDWFARHLDPFTRAGHVRLGVVAHAGPALSDADALDEVLGDHLDVVLSGGGEGTDVGALPSGAALVAPPAGSTRLVHVTAEGVDSWALPDDESAPTRSHRAWTRDARPFTAPAGSGPLIVDRLRPVEDDSEAQSPVERLLRRIAEVCEVRHPGARIRRLPGRPAALLVSYPDGDAVPQFLIAAHVGAPTAADVADLVLLRRRNGDELAAELVYQGPHPGVTLPAEAARDGVRVRSFTEFQGLLDLRGYVAAQTERLRQDRVYPPELYVTQRFRETGSADAAVRDDVVAELVELLSADEGRFILLMGDFGRGKTFAMRTLAMTLPARLPGVVPILIELHALDKSHSVEGLVAAHLANHGESRIDLRAFGYLLRQGRVVLLFDGFDELASRVSYDRAADHLNTLLEAAEGKAKIVVTSRTQHFQNDAQVRTALGERVGVLPQRRVLVLEDFTSDQIRAYLRNRFGPDRAVADERARLINDIDDLGGLSRNPRMLSFVADLDADRLAAVAARDAVSAAELYEEILSSWLVHEHRRANPPGAPAGLSVDDLWHAVTTLALRMFESNEALLQLVDVAEVAEALSGMAEAQLSPPQATHAVGAGSLLVRTENDMFGFIHRSVMEWLVAKEIARRLAEGQRSVPLLSRTVLSQLTVDFLCDLGDPAALQAWTARAADDVANANALKISRRLRTPVRSDLRGADLRGEDLSHRDFSGVDLTGADLGDALLIGAKLSRAVLRDARLRRARLDQAVLRDADLTGADLSGARLAEADLRGARVTGSRWTRAALINVAADRVLWSAPELAGAAITPGQPVLTGLPPAGVGVPFGFEDGRLPRPLAYSEDGSLLVVGSADGGVLVCDTAKGVAIRTLDGHLDRVYAVDLGPEDSALVTASADGTVRFWDPLTGEPGVVVSDHTAPVWPLLLDPRGRSVAYGDAAGVVWVRDVPDGAVRWRLPGHAERVWALAFHPDPDVPVLATADDSGAVRIWDLTTGEETRRLLTPGGTAVYTVSFSPDGSRLVAGGQSADLRIWDPVSGECVHHLDAHGGHVYAAAFHPTERLLASGDTTGAVRLWRLPDSDDDRPTGTALQHRQATAVYHLAFSPDGSTLASGDSDGTVRVWDGRTGQDRHEVAAHRGPVWPLAFRPDSAQLATTGRDGTLRLWDPFSGRQRHELRGHGRRVTRVAFDPTGDLLAASGNDGVVRIWDPRTGRQRRALTGVDDQLISASFNPAKPLLATASNDGGVHLWHLGTWRADLELDIETDYVWASAFAPDGDVLATANDDDTVRLWWQATGREIVTLHEHRGRVRSIAFSPDGRLVATGCDDSKVRLFDRDSGACLATLPGHTDRVYEVCFDADGTRLASVSNDGTAMLWDVARGEPTHVLRSQRGRWWTGAFSPDGRTFATAGDDAVVTLWDVATGERAHVLAGHTRRIWSVAFSPDGQRLASGGDDGTARLWDLSDPAGPGLGLTMVGLPGVWAALTPHGRYKFEGTLGSEFWHVIGLCRFEVGELDAFLSGVHSVPLDEPF